MAVTPGMKGEASIIVDQTHSASASGSANLPTLGLSALVSLLERAAANAARRGLEQGQETIGTRVEVRQHTPVPLGKRIRAEAVVTAVNGETITFSARAFDVSGQPVAEGVLERAIIDREQFIWSAALRGA
ncbi:MAG TPA: hotdog domain-containing protein [Chloroflexota bacterium]|jgi:fluoroacetyl-CoA thioesterase|nr:hotdog domain-containing protein [Chloroflexota bacterium]